LAFNLPALVTSTWPLLLPVAAFVIFVVQNGGVVVGKFQFVFE
jgi:hypothetical protein